MYIRKCPNNFVQDCLRHTKTSQQFCPRLSETIGSKILSLEQLFHTPSNFKFQNFAAGAFIIYEVFHFLYLFISYFLYIFIFLFMEGDYKNLNYFSENRRFLYLKSPHTTSIEPNMDEGLQNFYRFGGNPLQDFFWAKRLHSQL